MKPITKAIYNVLLAKGFEGTHIMEITQSSSTISLNLTLPPHKQLSDILELIPNLQQELKATDAKLGETSGKKISILFGMNQLDNILFHKGLLQLNTLKLQLPTAFGTYNLDFSDGASCHMLNGGAPRMGKTIFLLYLSTILYIQQQSNIQLFITSPKSKDFYPLFQLPNVTISQDENEFNEALDNVIEEYKARNQLLYSPAFKKATDAKTIKEYYPDQYHLFKPIFFIIDEYARFSNNKAIQTKVAELVQTAGYVNVHIIIATQRPDARNTLPANIKMGLITRICFKTADTNNSIVILDQEGAELLPNQKGRAILKDGETNIIQVPYLSYEECETLLKPYKKEIIINEPTNNKEEQRSTDSNLTKKIQDMFSESISLPNFPIQQQSNKRMQSHNETSNSGWFRLASKTDKR